MPKIQETTLVFLIKKSGLKISEICLAMKKRGFGAGRWNGAGGKVHHEKSETVEEAARRETKEEIGVEIGEMEKRAEMNFCFPHNPDWDQKLHVYFVENWQGEPTESEEMAPQWFSPNKLPFENMWPDDPFWLPEVIKGNLLKANFKFGEGDVILEKEVEIVSQK